MASPPLSVEVVRFGQYQANLRSRELRREGARVRLPDQSFEVLVMLLEHPGELIGREEIRKRLWSSDTFVDFDHGLNNAVKRLRDALGDSAESPRFVETLPRRGYRFICQVEWKSPAEAAANELKDGELQGASENPKRGSPSGGADRVRPHLVWIAVAAVLLAWPLYSVVRQIAVAPGQHASAIRSIAILPMESLSADATQDYFADGMTEQLITDLGQVKALRVISHTSVNQYKATRKTVPMIARELQVDALVEGTVTRSEGRIRVTANLVQAFPEKHLWAKTYDRDLKEILSLQGEISKAIARAVQVELTPEEQNSFVNRHPASVEAQEAYLKGLFHFVRGKDRLFARGEGIQELHKANDYFQQAIVMDPQYAEAYAGLARSYIWLGDAEDGEGYARAKMAADTAISLDETVAEAHMVLGGVLLNGNPDWVGAERELLRSIELNPSYAEAHQAYGTYLSYRGRFEEAITEADRAVMLDPVSRSPKQQAACIVVSAGHYDQGIMRLQNITEMFPEDALSHGALGVAYVLRGRFEEGIAELRRSADLWGRDVNRSPELGWAYAVAGKRENALRILNELKRASNHDADNKYGVALIYAGMGDKDQVFFWLDRAYADRHDVLNELWREPAFIPLRTDPRFRVLLQKTGVGV